MPSDSASLTPQRLLDLFEQHRTLLLAPAIAGAVLAAVSTLVSPRDWHAEQGLLIRSEAAGYSEQRLGKFTDLSEMKTVQETLLELARSQSVVTAVLSETLGREPSQQAISDFRDKLRLNPPGGAEFGKTEVFYLGMLDPNRGRAIALVESLTRELDKRLNELRHERASSLVAEVTRSVAVARDQMRNQIETLSRYERSVGADLIELRQLTTPNGGLSELGQRSLAISAERRALASRVTDNRALLAELKAAEQDPSRLDATPDALLTSQPSLRRLKNGLVDAQLAVARISGLRTADHPHVLAARRVRSAVHEELVRELPSAIVGVQLELQVAQRRDAQLGSRLASLRARSADLAGKRSHYAELVASVEGQTRVLEDSLKQLADARAHQAGVGTASVLSPIDSVETGAHPVGPGRTTVTAAGGLAGLIFGAALVFVLYAPRVETAPVGVSAATTAPEPAAARSPIITPAVSPGAPAAEPSPWAIETAKPTKANAPAPETFVATTESLFEPSAV